MANKPVDSSGHSDIMHGTAPLGDGTEQRGDYLCICGHLWTDHEHGPVYPCRHQLHPDCPCLEYEPESGLYPTLTASVSLTPDVTCEHGTAMDVHCCNCHSGFLFDINSCVCGDGL
jgi:hypothetical protein